MSSSPSAATMWWTFFPLKGLDITDRGHDLDTPLFGDATIISKRHVRQIVPLLRMNERMSPGHDHEGGVVFMMEHATFQSDFQSFIAVKRYGRQYTAMSETQEASNAVSSLAKDAARRAYTVASVLGLVLLARSSSGDTCGLVEQVYGQTKSLVMLELREGGFRFESGGAGRPIGSTARSIRMPRTELRSRLYKEASSGLSAALLPTRRLLSTSLHRAVNEASVTLSSAVHSPALSSQVLGAITAIEILVSEQGDSYDTIRGRLSALLGTECTAAHQVEEILNTRHLYVHRGEEAEDSTVAVRAVSLGLSSLFRYAMAAPRFSSKRHLVEYLDLLTQADRFAQSWTENENSAFSGLLRHEREGFTFPFVSAYTQQVSQPI